MTTVTVSPEHQVILSGEILEEIHAGPGQQLAVFRVGNLLKLVRVRDIREMRGFAPGLSAEGIREEEDRL